MPSADSGGNKCLYITFIIAYNCSGLMNLYFLSNLYKGKVIMVRFCLIKIYDESYLFNLLE